MTWILVLPGHLQPWYWLWRIKEFFSSMRKDFEYLCHIKSWKTIENTNVFLCFRKKKSARQRVENTLWNQGFIYMYIYTTFLFSMSDMPYIYICIYICIYFYVRYAVNPQTNVIMQSIMPPFGYCRNYYYGTLSSLSSYCRSFQNYWNLSV